MMMYFRKGTNVAKDEAKKQRDISFAGILNGNIMQIGFTKCNPREQFEKRKARLIAGGRAVKHPISAMNIEGMSKKDVIKAFVNVCKELKPTV